MGWDCQAGHPSLTHRSLAQALATPGRRIRGTFSDRRPNFSRGIGARTPPGGPRRAVLDGGHDAGDNAGRSAQEDD